jgi:hypothetical protein
MSSECEKTRSCGSNGNYSPDVTAYTPCDPQNMVGLERLPEELRQTLRSDPEFLKALVETADENNLGICRFKDGDWGQYDEPPSLLDILWGRVEEQPFFAGGILLGIGSLISLTFKSVRTGFENGARNVFGNVCALFTGDEIRTTTVDESVLLPAEGPDVYSSRMDAVREALRENPDLYRKFIKARDGLGEALRLSRTSGSDESFASGEAKFVERTLEFNKSSEISRIRTLGGERGVIVSEMREGRGRTRIK